MKNQIKYFLSALALVSFGLTAQTVYAISGSSIRTIDSSISDTVRVNIAITATPTPTPTASPTIKIDKNLIQIRTTLKKTNALNEINRRLESLNKLITKITSITRLDSTQKETLIAQVQIEMAKLEDLKSKITNETDKDALQVLKKSVYDSYRIYGLFIPKIEIILHADRIINLANALAAKTTQSGLLEILASSKAKAQSAIDLVLPLTPEGYPDNKVTLQKARDLLRDARTNLNTVYTTLKATNP